MWLDEKLAVSGADTKVHAGSWVVAEIVRADFVDFAANEVWGWDDGVIFFSGYIECGTGSGVLGCLDGGDGDWSTLNNAFEAGFADSDAGGVIAGGRVSVVNGGGFGICRLAVAEIPAPIPAVFAKDSRLDGELAFS